MSKNTWGGARKGAGAPKSVGFENRRRARAIQMNDAEYSRLVNMAKNAGVSISEFVRNKVFENL